MTAIAAAPAALYCTAQDHAVSAAGDELRESLREALEPPRTRAAEMFERIARALRKGRDSEGILVNVEPFGRVAAFLAMLPLEVPLPKVVVESENQIGLDWDEGVRRVLTVTINNTAYVGFAALIGHEPLHGRAPFGEQIPETVAYLLSRLYPASVAAFR
jgi:hypothetical protein